MTFHFPKFKKPYIVSTFAYDGSKTMRKANKKPTHPNAY